MRPYDERLEQFLTQAARVFAERGYHATTMRDLAGATGMSLAGMYYYVRGKEDLLFGIQERGWTRLLAGAEEALAPLAHAEPVERLQAFVRHHVTFFAAHSPEMKVLAHDAGALSGERHRIVAEMKRGYGSLLEGLVAEVAPTESYADRSAAAAILLGMMNGVDGEMDVERLAGLVTRIFLGGFAPAPSPVHG